MFPCSEYLTAAPSKVCKDPKVREAGWSGGQGGNPAPNPSSALPSCGTFTKFPDT